MKYTRIILGTVFPPPIFEGIRKGSCNKIGKFPKQFRLLKSGGITEFCLRASAKFLFARERRGGNRSRGAARLVSLTRSDGRKTGEPAGSVCAAGMRVGAFAGSETVS